MTISIIQSRLGIYSCQSQLEEEQALREISQEVILAALSRSGFFKHAVFHGGTCLRIFYSLPRFSEDLDFVLQSPDANFSLEPFLQRTADEIKAYGYEPEIQDRSRAKLTVQKAFIKDDSIGKILNLNFIRQDKSTRKIRIKIEVDTRPPSGGKDTLLYLDFPFSAAVRTHDLPSLFAGKIHALLCREYLKGRDWFDFIWYTSRKTAINMVLLESAVDQAGPWAGKTNSITMDWCKEQLRDRILSIDWKAAAGEVAPFLRIQEQSSMQLWSKELFLGQLEKLGQA